MKPAEEHHEPVPRVIGVEPALAAGTRGQAAATAQVLRQVLEAQNCVWGYREHVLRADKDAPGTMACGRCGYTAPPAEPPQQGGTQHGVVSQGQAPRPDRGPRGRRVGLQVGRVTGG